MTRGCSSARGDDLRGVGRVLDGGRPAGSVLGDPETLGLDAAFPALFLALLAGQIRERRRCSPRWRARRSR